MVVPADNSCIARSKSSPVLKAMMIPQVSPQAYSNRSWQKAILNVNSKISAQAFTMNEQKGGRQALRVTKSIGLRGGVETFSTDVHCKPGGAFRNA